MENRPPIIVLVDKDQPDCVSSEFFVSPLPQPRAKPSSAVQDVLPVPPKRSQDDTASVETASVASDIDSSCDGSVASRSSLESEHDDGRDASMEFEMEVKKLKLLKQQKEQTHLKHPHLTHPFSQEHDPRHNTHRHPQLQSQLHPQKEKELRGMVAHEQTEMIQEIHNMLSLLIDDNHGTSETSKSSSNSSKKKSRSRNNHTLSRSRNNQSQSKRDIALLAKDKLSRFKSDAVESLRQAESYDPRQDRNSVSRRSPSNSVKSIPAPPFWDSPSAQKNSDEIVQSKRLVSPDDISARLMSGSHTSHPRSVKPQGPKSGKPITGSLHDNFSSSFTFENPFEKSPHAQKLRRSSHNRSSITMTPSMHERFSSSINFEKSPQPRRSTSRRSSHNRSSTTLSMHDFSSSLDFERSPQVQKALRLSSHRRKMPAAPNMHERFSQSFNLERSPDIRNASRRRYSSGHIQGMPLSPTLDERNSEHFELEMEPEIEEKEVLEPKTPKKTSRIKSLTSSLHQRFTKSPVLQKALKFSTHNRTPRRTKKGEKSVRSETPSEGSGNLRKKKRGKTGKSLKKAPSQDISTKSKAQNPKEQQATPVKPVASKDETPKPKTEEAKPLRTVTPESSRHGRKTVASPGMEESMSGEKLHKQVHKSQPDLAGRITGVLMEYNNADELVHMLEGPEEGMTERIVEVLEVLKGHGSTRAKPRTIKNVSTIISRLYHCFLIGFLICASLRKVVDCCGIPPTITVESQGSCAHKQYSHHFIA